MIVDLTGIATSALAGFFGILAVALPSIIDRHMRAQAARDVLRRAIHASVGALQQAGTVSGRGLAAATDVHGVPAGLAPAVRYVLDNAGEEAERLGVSAEQIAQKITAQIGLIQIGTNQAVAGSAGSMVPDPLGPVPVASAPVGPGPLGPVVPRSIT